MIEGKKAYLTAVNKTSISQLQEWRNNPALRRYFREYREISDEMQKRWYEERVLSNKDQVDFEIHDAATGKLIGHCGLYYISCVNRTAEFTVYIGDMSYRQGGFGSDALRLLFTYGFDTLNLNRIWCEVYSNNEAINVYRHLGFKDEGCLRQHHYDEGRYWDSHMLGLLREEWNLLQKS